MAKLVGIAPFDYTECTDGGGHDLQTWVRSFDWYLQANKIEDDHEKFVKLMHLAGSKVQELFATLPVPESVKKVNRRPLRDGFVPQLTEYEMALAKLNEHFQPKKNLTYERHVFRQIKQEAEEKVAFFTMRLRKQADRCEFGDKFEEQVKDQIIENCASEKLRLKLLSLGDANLDRIMNEAKTFEAVQEQNEALNGKRTEPNKTEEVNKIEVRSKAKQISTGKDEFYGCGYTGHRQYDEKCPAKGKTCIKCGGFNHFGRKCNSKNQKRGFPNKSYQAKTEAFGKLGTKRGYSAAKRENDEPIDKKTKTEDTETVKMIDSYQSNVKDEYIFCIGDHAENEIKCEIGGVPVTVVIDSGSRYNIVDAKAWERLKVNKIKVLSQSKGPNGHDFKSYGNFQLTMIGSFKAKIETSYNECVAEFCVLQNYGKILIGYVTGKLLGVMKIGENVNLIDETKELNKIKGVVVDIPINQEVKPVAQPYRRIPVPLEEKVDKKIDELLAQGIIEKVKKKKKKFKSYVYKRMNLNEKYE